MFDITMLRGKFAKEELDDLTASLAQRLGVTLGSERWDELRFDQR